MGAVEQATRTYYRSSLDVLRVLVLAVIAAVMVVLTIAVEDSTLGFEHDLISLFDFLSSSIERFLQGSVELLSGLVIVAIFAVPILTRRFRLFGYLVALPVGVAIGAAVLVAFGRPDRRPTARAVAAGLSDAGLNASRIEQNDGGRSQSAYTAIVSEDGAAEHDVDIKVLGADERAADLLAHGSRFVRLKDVGNFRPFSPLRRRVEHEALVALFARDVGARTQRVRAVVDLGGDAMLIAHDAVNGTRLVPDPAKPMTDEMLRDI
jgi:hypothetical protein